MRASNPRLQRSAAGDKFTGAAKTVLPTSAAAAEPPMRWAAPRASGSAVIDSAVRMRAVECLERLRPPRTEF
jgi:hypothetical protein